MMKKALFLGYGILLVVVVAMGSSSCKKDKTSPATSGDCPDTISFATKIEPLIQQNCSTTGCHDAASAGGYNLLGHSNISANATIVLSVIKHDAGVTPMPFGGTKLADSLATQFNCWIQQGKLNN